MNNRMIFGILIAVAILLNGLSFSPIQNLKANTLYQDDIPPEINNVSYPKVTYSKSVNISVEVNDDSSVDKVLLILEFPLGQKYEEIQMHNIQNSNIYYLYKDNLKYGNYAFFIKAYDIHQNMNYSDFYKFRSIDPFVTDPEAAQVYIGEAGINWYDEGNLRSYGHPWFGLDDVKVDEPIYTVDYTVEYELYLDVISDIQDDNLEFERIAKFIGFCNESNNSEEIDIGHETIRHKDLLKKRILVVEGEVDSYVNETINITVRVRITPRIDILPTFINMIFELIGLEIPFPELWTMQFGEERMESIQISFEVIHLFPPR